MKFLVGGGQLLEFFQLSTKILAQFLEKDKRLETSLQFLFLFSLSLSSSSLESAAGLDLVSSVLGCLVNISSCKELLLVRNAKREKYKPRPHYLPW